MMALNAGAHLGPYEVVAAIGSGGRAAARAGTTTRELWRGLAEAQQRPRL